MSSAEFSEWLAYDRIDPIGNVRGDLQTGILASTMVNLKKRKGPRTKPADFMPKFGKARASWRQQSGAQMAAVFGMFAGMQNRIAAKEEKQQ